MARGKPRPTKSHQRLLRLFAEVEDEDIREIMYDVTVLEGRHRSAKNFPVRKIRDIVDRVARLQEELGD